MDQHVPLYVLKIGLMGQGPMYELNIGLNGCWHTRTLTHPDTSELWYTRTLSDFDTPGHFRTLTHPDTSGLPILRTFGTSRLRTFGTWLPRDIVHSRRRFLAVNCFDSNAFEIHSTTLRRWNMYFIISFQGRCIIRLNMTFSL